MGHSALDTSGDVAYSCRRFPKFYCSMMDQHLAATIAFRWPRGVRGWLIAGDRIRRVGAISFGVGSAGGFTFCGGSYEACVELGDRSGAVFCGQAGSGAE